MHFKSLAIVGVCAGVLASGTTFAQNGVTASTVVIGQSAPLTGSNAELGNDIRNGALAYFAKVNVSGGVNGRKLELTTLDDGNQVPRSEANTKKLVEETGVFALVGVVPPPGKRSLPIVQEYQTAIEKQLGKKEYSFTSLESYIGAKVLVEALRKAGPKPTREGFMNALDGMKAFDTGGYVVGFSPSNHNGSSFVELTIIGQGQKFNY